MIKKLLLFFLCLSLFLSISDCKKKLPTTPDIPTKVLPTIEYFHATPTSITIGGVSILSWSTKNATNIKINQGVGTVSAKDTVEVYPEETTTYTLTAINSDGQKTASCKVEVTSLNLPIIDYFTAMPDSITAGAGSSLAWSVQPEGLTEALRIEPLGDLTISWVGSHTVYPTETTTYTLIATNDDGETTASCTVEVSLPNYEGTWSGFYVLYDCDDEGVFAGECENIPQNVQLNIELNLEQDQDQVTGDFSLGERFFADAKGSIAEDGELWLKGSAQVGDYTVDAELQLQLTSPGQITGDICWFIEGGTDYLILVNGYIETLTRN